MTETETPWVVWSEEHGGWWRPGERPGEFGYTQSILTAGRFTKEHALAIEARANFALAKDGVASNELAMPDPVFGKFGGVIVREATDEEQRAALDRPVKRLIDEVLEPAVRQMSYRDDRWPERACDHCGKLYRGPAVYCSLECAVDDL